MSANHTPGPWHADKLTIYAAGAGNIAHVCQSVLLGNAKQNAALIAAAPELLTIAIHAARMDIAPDVLQKRARAAIAKAKGGA